MIHQKILVIFYSTCSLRDHVANVRRSKKFQFIFYWQNTDIPWSTHCWKVSECHHNIKVGLLQQLIVRNSQGAHHPTSNASKSYSSGDHSMAQIRPHYTCPRRSPLAPCKAEDWFLNASALLNRPWMDSHLHTYANISFRTYSPTRTLRSKENHQLTSLRYRLENFGKRSCTAAAPMLWNDLPPNIKRSPSVDIFKSRIKTRLFQLAYFTCFILNGCVNVVCYYFMLCTMD